MALLPASGRVKTDPYNRVAGLVAFPPSRREGPCPRRKHRPAGRLETAFCLVSHLPLWAPGHLILGCHVHWREKKGIGEVGITCQPALAFCSSCYLRLGVPAGVGPRLFPSVFDISFAHREMNPGGQSRTASLLPRWHGSPAEAWAAECGRERGRDGISQPSSESLISQRK